MDPSLTPPVIPIEPPPAPQPAAPPPAEPEAGQTTEEAPPAPEAAAPGFDVASIPMEFALPFVIVALANNAILTTIKRSMMIAIKEGGSALNSGKTKAALTLANPVLGAISGVLPGVFPDYMSWGMRGMLGVVAGLFSIPIYKYVLKKYLPGLMLTSEHSSRSAGK